MLMTNLNSSLSLVILLTYHSFHLGSTCKMVIREADLAGHLIYFLHIIRPLASIERSPIVKNSPTLAPPCAVMTQEFLSYTRIPLYIQLYKENFFSICRRISQIVPFDERDFSLPPSCIHPYMEISPCIHPDR